MKIHIVQKGDTMWSIARKYGVSFDELRELNGHIREPELAVPGMKLKIPSTAKVVEKEAVLRSEAGGSTPPVNTGQQTPAPTFHDTPPIQEDDMSAAPYPIMPQMPQISMPGQGGGSYPNLPQQQAYTGALPMQPITQMQPDQQLQGFPSYQPQQGIWQQPQHGSWLIQQPGYGGMPQHGGWNMQGMQPGQQMQGDWSMQGMQPGQQLQGDWNMQGMQPGQQLQGDWNMQGGQPGQQMQGDWSMQGMQPGQQLQGDWGMQGGQPGQQLQGDWGMQGGQPGQQMQGDWGMQGGQPGQQMQGDWGMQGGQPGQQMQGDWGMQGGQPGQQMGVPYSPQNQAAPYSYPPATMRSCCGPDIPFTAVPEFTQAQPEYRDPYGVQQPLADFYEPSPAHDLPGEEQEDK